MASLINTVTGPISPEKLGRTLMHEHVFVEYGTATKDTRPLGAARPQIISTCLDFAGRVKACGVATVVDPTTTDLGRNMPGREQRKDDAETRCTDDGAYLHVRETELDGNEADGPGDQRCIEPEHESAECYDKGIAKR